MKKYWNIYKVFLANSFSVEAQYRKHIVLNLFTNLAYMGLVFLTIHILFQYAEAIGNWTKGEVFLLSTIWIIVDEICILFFEPNIRSIPDKVTRGELDLYFTKPVNSLFLITAEKIQLNNLYKLVIQFGILGFILNYFQIDLDLISILLSIFLIGCSSIILYSVLLFLNTLSFWFYKIDNINGAWFTFYDFGKYPLNILPKFMKILFLTAIPIAYTAYFPTQALLGKISPTVLFFVFGMTLIFFVLSLLFWRHAVKSYTSASS